MPNDKAFPLILYIEKYILLKQTPKALYGAVTNSSAIGDEKSYEQRL